MLKSLRIIYIKSVGVQTVFRGVNLLSGQSQTFNSTFRFSVSINIIVNTRRISRRKLLSMKKILLYRLIVYE